MGIHFYRPAQGHRLAHNLFNAIVAPRPNGRIGTLGPDGRRNLAPYSFLHAFNYTPPLGGFSSTERKHTVANLEATGEFSWNLVTRSLAAQMNTTPTTDDVDEFERAGLEAAGSVEIAAPRVAASPVSLECRLGDLINLRGASGEATTAWLVIGEVVAVHIDDRFLVNGVYDTAGAEPVLRGGGPTAYFGISPDHRFDLRRPR